jgi:hypothetical protein
MVPAVDHLGGEITILEAPATAGTALFAPAILLRDHLERQAYKGPHIGRQHSVGTRHQHHLVLAI